MKKLVLLVYLISLYGTAQIKGNKILETKRFPFQNVDIIKIDLNAKITIDTSTEATLEITAESNLFEHIDTEIVDGTIYLNQLEWIEPTEDITIKIGAPQLKRLVHGTNNTTKVININTDKLRVNAYVGKVILEGKTKILRLGSELGEIDASKLKSEEVYANIWSSGKVSVDATTYLWADISNNGRLIYINLPKNNDIKTKSGGMAISKWEVYEKMDDVRWINFKIKNNSDDRNHFIVKGPKADGSYFGYEFPMMPQAIRKETWSIGTKVYTKTRLGFKKLILTIKEDNEGKTVDLFE